MFNQSVSEIAESLTGYDQDLIERTFKKTMTEIGDSSSALYSMVFVGYLREGMNPKDAYSNAMGLTLKEAMNAFAPEEAEVFEDKPVTDQGKDDSELSN